MTQALYAHMNNKTHTHTYKKRCLTFMTIKEMQIKITLRFHHNLFRMATIKNTNNNKCQRECGEKGTVDDNGN
jgi:hypothetical protein